MSREIKFRAWDNYGKSWLNDNISIALSGQKYYNHRDNGTFEKLEYALQDLANTVIFMQYTGLKDKNGVEIYEGDIVRSEISGENDLFLINLNRLDWFVSPKGHTFDNSWVIFEVIGNIYENGDLLK